MWIQYNASEFNKIEKYSQIPEQNLSNLEKAPDLKMFMNVKKCLGIPKIIMNTKNITKSKIVRQFKNIFN